MTAGAGTRSLVSSSFRCQSNNLISAEQLVLDYRLSTISSPHGAAELICFSYRSIMSQNNTQLTCIMWNEDKMGSGVKDRSCITDPLSLHINTHHQGVSIHSFLEPVLLISLGVILAEQCIYKNKLCLKGHLFLALPVSVPGWGTP